MKRRVLIAAALALAAMLIFVVCVVAWVWVDVRAERAETDRMWRELEAVVERTRAEHGPEALLSCCCIGPCVCKVITKPLFRRPHVRPGAQADCGRDFEG